ncbi:MAG: sulfurtransferase [Rhodospirillales bacterium]|nr:sulfurtransferase [Rhodospirillales bacterium]
MTTPTEKSRRLEFFVETDWLAQHLDDPDLRVFDCTVIAGPNPDLEKAKTRPFAFQSGRPNYDQGHIPGAGFFDILSELSDASSELPLMVPPAPQFADAMARYGIGDNTRVVLYSTAEPMWAARGWWMLRAFGFDNAVVLNGGWAKWRAEGRPVSDLPCKYPRGQFTVRPRPDVFVGKAEVLAAIDDQGACIINALPPAMHTGSGGPVFGRKGRIAGSVNVPVGSLHDPDTGAYLPLDTLQEVFDTVQAGDADRIITYCGGGIASSNDAFVLVMLGHDNVAVYDGSMFEWGDDPSLPMETG